jgi:hypothetical protein
MLSSWLGGVLCIILTIIVGVFGVRVVRKLIPSEILRQTNEIAAPIHAAIGVIYAVFLAFVVVIVWGQYNNADDAADSEANSLIALERSTSFFPDSIKLQLREKIRLYSNSVINTEWPLFERGDCDRYKSKPYIALWQTIGALHLETEHDHIWLQMAYQQLNTIDIARNKRFLYVESSVPLVMWILLIFGALITIWFTAFFGIEHRFVHSIMVASLSAIIGFMLFVIMAIDNPFVGVVKIEPEAFRHVIEQLQM